jgi:ribosomal protein S18 acetylase RimI-like enzyme
MSHEVTREIFRELKGQPIKGEGLELCVWDRQLLEQLASWGERGFPYGAFDLGYLRNRKEAEVALNFVLNGTKHLHFIACEDSVAVGRVSVNLEDPAGLYIWSVHVPPEHARRRVAYRMLTVLIKWLEGKYPNQEIVLTVNAFANHARRLYLLLGFNVRDTLWRFDPKLNEEIYQVSVNRRRVLEDTVRFVNNRWEVMTYLMVFQGFPSKG